MRAIRTYFAIIIAVVLGGQTQLLGQTIVTFPLPGTVGATLSGLSRGPDGAMWFTDPVTNKIGRITLAGAVSEFPIPTSNSSPSRIQPGPDGAMWFDEVGANKIGRIDMNGNITEFLVLTPNSQPVGIWAGPDGAIWFPERGPTKIAKITTGGVLTEYNTVPTPAAGVRGLGPGPDGAMWFTEDLVNQIGRITTSGVVTEYPIPTVGSGPRSIKSGPDGALWFVEHDANNVGRITTAGVVTEFKIPTKNSKPSYLREGPDGAMWFVENSAFQIGRITTAGIISEIPIPNVTELDAIAPGPDGNLWFTGINGGAPVLGYIVPPQVTSPLVASVLPTSRSVQVGSPATVFATIINAGNSAASGCAIAPVGDIAGSFLYQTTNPSTNALSGSPNTPASIGAGGLQSFLIAITPNAPNSSTDLQIGFDCTGLASAGTIAGINTLKLVFDSNPVPDMIAVGVTPSNDGFARTGGNSGTGVFAVATTNVGTAAALTAKPRLTDSSMPIAVTICETNASAQCLAPQAANVSRSFAHNEAATFSIFLKASGAVAADPARFRVFLEFLDAGSVVRGSTSTAVTTQ